MEGLYNRAFTINAASIILFKSSRKNARCADVISVNHLINNAPDRRVSDARIMEQFVNVLEKVVYTAAGFNNHLELSVYLDYGKNTSYTAVNGQYSNWEPVRYCWQRVTFSSIEQVINFLYSIFCLIYPYNELNCEHSVHQNASVKQLIRQYYKGV